MKTEITTFLTFQENNAEQAMNFYIGLFDNSRITDVQRYGKDGPGKEGSIMKATFLLNGKEFICSDSFIKHTWTFTPAISHWIECNDVHHMETLFSRLGENGFIMMPLGSYGFSQKFGWVADQFGISWQVNLQ